MLSIISCIALLASAVTAQSASASASAPAAAATHTVAVGQGGYVYSPNSLMANTGGERNSRFCALNFGLCAITDTVLFQFGAQNSHSVSQSFATSPCVPVDSVNATALAFNTGYVDMTQTYVC